MKHIILLSLLFVVFSAHAEKPVAPASIPGTTLISAEQLVDLIEKRPELVIVDTRLHDEYAKGHIDGAIFLLDTQLTEELLGKHVRSKDSPVVFYCNGERCKRSSNASRKAVQWGYRQVYWFRGGWQEWSSKALPVSY